MLNKYKFIAELLFLFFLILPRLALAGLHIGTSEIYSVFFPTTMYSPTAIITIDSDFLRRTNTPIATKIAKYFDKLEDLCPYRHERVTVADKALTQKWNDLTEKSAQIFIDNQKTMDNISQQYFAQISNANIASNGSMKIEFNKSNLQEGFRQRNIQISQEEFEHLYKGMHSINNEKLAVLSTKFMFTQILELRLISANVFILKQNYKKNVYIIHQDCSPFVDKQGNLYIPEDISKQYTTEELFLIMAHESSHLYTELESPFSETLIRDDLKNILQEIKTSEISGPKEPEEMNTAYEEFKKIYFGSKKIIESTEEKEMAIDVLALQLLDFNARDIENYKKVLLKISSGDIDDSNNRRIKQLNILEVLVKSGCNPKKVLHQKLFYDVLTVNIIQEKVRSDASDGHKFGFALKPAASIAINALNTTEKISLHELFLLQGGSSYEIFQSLSEFISYSLN